MAQPTTSSLQSSTAAYYIPPAADAAQTAPTVAMSMASAQTGALQAQEGATSAMMGMTAESAQATASAVAEALPSLFSGMIPVPPLGEALAPPALPQQRYNLRHRENSWAIRRSDARVQAQCRRSLNELRVAAREYQIAKERLQDAITHFEGNKANLVNNPRLSDYSRRYSADGAEILVDAAQSNLLLPASTAIPASQWVLSSGIYASSRANQSTDSAHISADSSFGAGAAAGAAAGAMSPPSDQRASLPLPPFRQDAAQFLSSASPLAPALGTPLRGLPSAATGADSLRSPLRDLTSAAAAAGGAGSLGSPLRGLPSAAAAAASPFPPYFARDLSSATSSPLCRRRLSFQNPSMGASPGSIGSTRWAAGAAGYNSPSAALGLPISSAYYAAAEAAASEQGGGADAPIAAPLLPPSTAALHEQPFGFGSLLLPREDESTTGLSLGMNGTLAAQGGENSSAAQASSAAVGALAAALAPATAAPGAAAVDSAASVAAAIPAPAAAATPSQQEEQHPRRSSRTKRRRKDLE